VHGRAPRNQTGAQARAGAPAGAIPAHGRRRGTDGTTGTSGTRKRTRSEQQSDGKTPKRPARRASRGAQPKILGRTKLAKKQRAGPPGAVDRTGIRAPHSLDVPPNACTSKPQSAAHDADKNVAARPRGGPQTGPPPPKAPGARRALRHSRPGDPEKTLAAVITVGGR